MFSFWRRSHETPDEKLRRAFEFDETDLEANRSGQLSESQSTVLRQDALSHFLGGLLSLMLPGSCAAYLAFYEPRAVGLIVFGVILLLVPIIYIQSSILMFQDDRDGTVASIQGVIEPSVRRGFAGIEVLPLRKEFSASRSERKAFIKEQEYALYYTPRSKRLVAAEHVPTDSKRK